MRNYRGPLVRGGPRSSSYRNIYSGKGTRASININDGLYFNYTLDKINKPFNQMIGSLELVNLTNASTNLFAESIDAFPTNHGLALVPSTYFPYLTHDHITEIMPKEPVVVNVRLRPSFRSFNVSLSFFLRRLETEFSVTKVLTFFFDPSIGSANPISIGEILDMPAFVSDITISNSVNIDPDGFVNVRFYLISNTYEVQSPFVSIYTSAGDTSVNFTTIYMGEGSPFGLYADRVQFYRLSEGNPIPNAGIGLTEQDSLTSSGTVPVVADPGYIKVYTATSGEGPFYDPTNYYWIDSFTFVNGSGVTWNGSSVAAIPYNPSTTFTTVSTLNYYKGKFVKTVIDPNAGGPGIDYQYDYYEVYRAPTTSSLSWAPRPVKAYVASDGSGEGPFYEPTDYYWSEFDDGTGFLINNPQWNGVTVGSPTSNFPTRITTFTTGGKTYYKGKLVFTDISVFGTTFVHEIYRANQTATLGWQIKPLKFYDGTIWVAS